jgi:hypothetical protein
MPSASAMLRPSRSTPPKSSGSNGSTAETLARDKQRGRCWFRHEKNKNKEIKNKENRNGEG